MSSFLSAIYRPLCDILCRGFHEFIVSLTVTDRVREQLCKVAKSRNLSKPSSSERYMAKTSPEKISARLIMNFPELQGFKVWGRRRRPKTSKINFWP